MAWTLFSIEIGLFFLKADFPGGFSQTLDTDLNKGSFRFCRIDSGVPVSSFAGKGQGKSDAAGALPRFIILKPGWC